MNNTSFTSEKEGKYTENVNLLENNNNKTQKNILILFIILIFLELY